MGRSTADLADHTLFIRRIYDRDNDPTKPIVRPLCKSNPLRGELELQAFGRDHLEAFDSKRTKRKISVLLMTFIDGFGLYRNAYRTVMGVYTIFAGLSFQERALPANVIPLTLGPHGSNFADVVDALKAGLISQQPQQSFQSFLRHFLKEESVQQHNPKPFLGCPFSPIVYKVRFLC